MKITAAVALALLTLASPAFALTDEQRLAWYLPVAREAWPGSPCAGREQVTLHDDAELDALVATFGFRPDGVSYGSLLCTVGITSGLSDYRFCVALTHEFGHVAGYVAPDGGIHSADPENVMYAGEIMDYAPCLLRTSQLGTYLPGRPQLVADAPVVAKTWKASPWQTVRRRHGARPHVTGPSQ